MDITVTTEVGQFAIVPIPGTVEIEGLVWSCRAVIDGNEEVITCTFPSIELLRETMPSA